MSILVTSLRGHGNHGPLRWRLLWIVFTLVLFTSYINEFEFQE